MYRSLFFDLDDTLWAFTLNARDTLHELYNTHLYNRFFLSFDHFYAIYQKRNLELWEQYARGEVDKTQLNHLRFLYPLQAVGAEDADLASRFASDFFDILPTKTRLVPHTVELLDYLSEKGYRLYILSNGFRELQARKMQSAGISHYFRRIVLSEDIGLLKPHPEIFHFALSATQSEATTSLMVGDSWESDVTGARNAGIAQVYYHPERTTTPHSFAPTYEVTDLRELASIL